MTKRVALGFLSLLSVVVIASSSRLYNHLKVNRWDASADARVRIDSGILEGGHPAPDVLAWLGIPYAQAPVGDLRWRAPQQVAAWSGVRRATAWGSICPQDGGPRWKRPTREWQSEDCLHLNVWAPAKPGKYPVAFFIHSGGNTISTSSGEYLDGFSMAHHGIVLVTLDFRIGVFGFLSSPGLDSESPHRTSGDYGLLDIVEGLKWVQRNIGAFGGDASQVTIMGESGGAHDVSVLMTSPLARGLFVRAIEESGQALGMMPVASHEESIEAWSVAVQKLGSDPKSMRQASTQEVMAATSIPASYPQDSTWGLRTTSIDGWVVPERPSDVWATGHEAAIPLIIGYNVQELPLYHSDPSGVAKAMQRTLGDEAARLQSVYAKDRQTIFGADGMRFATDRDFHCPAAAMALWHSSHGSQTFVYRFDRPFQRTPTAIHSSEIPYVFGRLVGSDHPTDDALASNMIQSYWFAFARGGAMEPVNGLPMWPAFDTDHKRFLLFPVAFLTPEVHEDFGGEPCKILEPRVLPGFKDHDAV